jgi:deazaflavin-dependent oxidoreductase (nitroreductase family)
VPCTSHTRPCRQVEPFPSDRPDTVRPPEAGEPLRVRRFRERQPPDSIDSAGDLMTPQRKDAMPEERNWNAEVIAEFRANKGEVASPYPDPPPMLLLYTSGARSGREHVVPMRCLPDGDTLYVFASAHGSVRNPDWYHNVVADPDITIEKGTETIPVHATEVFGEERDAIFARQADRFPVFAEYERTLDRTIPVIRLDRRTT